VAGAAREAVARAADGYSNLEIELDAARADRGTGTSRRCCAS
jgi:hypothetical protein